MRISAGGDQQWSSLPRPHLSRREWKGRLLSPTIREPGSPPRVWLVGQVSDDEFLSRARINLPGNASRGAAKGGLFAGQLNVSLRLSSTGCAADRRLAYSFWNQALKLLLPFERASVS